MAFILNKSNIKDFEDFRKLLEVKLVNSAELFEALQIGLMTAKCVVLTGPPGYGKSDTVEMLQQFTHFVGNTTVIPCNSMSQFTELTNNFTVEAKSFLTPDFSRWKKPDGSWVKLVVFEEMFDLNPRTLESLKFILANGYYINEDQVKIEIGVECFLALTNKKMADIVSAAEEKDKNSMQGAVDRFGRDIHWVWNNHDRDAWARFFNLFNLAPDKKELFASTLGRLGKSGVPFSPRHAKVLAMAFDQSLPEMNLKINIQTLSGLDQNMKDLLLAELTKTQNIQFNKQQIVELETAIKNKIRDITQSNAPAMTKYKRLETLREHISQIRCNQDDKFQSLVSNMCDQIYNSMKMLSREHDTSFDKMYATEHDNIRKIIKLFK